MEAYLQLALSLKTKFSCCDFKRILRSENNHADSLASLASAIGYKFRREIPVEHIPTQSIQWPDKEILCLDTSPGWRDPIIAYLKDGTCPAIKQKYRSSNMRSQGMRSSRSSCVRNLTPNYTPTYT